MSKFALVSTVASMGPEFPRYCVMLFETEQEAYECAMKCIAEHDAAVEYVDFVARWKVGHELCAKASDALAEWNSHLDVGEYFRVLPIQAWCKHQTVRRTGPRKRKANRSGS